MRSSLLCFASALLLLGAACKKSPSSDENAAAAQQKLRDEKKAVAAKAYKDLIEKYPDSPFAAKARERLSALGPIATPAPKK